MKKTRYICFEGVEGSYKTTNTQRLADYLKDKGFSVLVTKEPGTPHSPLTMKLREIMLSNEFASEMTDTSREFISQAIRSIHLENVVWPAMGEYDFIIQDRGTLSGYAYATTIGHDSNFITDLIEYVCDDTNEWNIYDDVVLLLNNPASGLELAQQKQEFKDGDAMESKGADFMVDVLETMIQQCEQYGNTHFVDVRDNDPDTVFADILNVLGLN